MIYMVWLLVLLLGWIVPWWLMFVLAIFIGFIEDTRLSSMKVGFFGFFFPWLALTVGLDLQHQGLVALRLAGMLGVGYSVWIYLLIATAGGFLAATMSWLGHELYLFNVAVRLKKRREFKNTLSV